MTKKNVTKKPVKKSKKVSFATVVKRIENAMKKAKKKGIKLITGDWGVQYNIEKKRWEATKPYGKKKACACAMGAVLISENPKLTDKEVKSHLSNMFPCDDEPAPGSLSSDDIELTPIVASLLKLTEAEVNEFIGAYDSPSWVNEPTAIEAAAIEIRKKFLPK